MTLSELEADLYRRLGYDTSPAATVTTRLRAFINETHRDILALPGMERLRDATLTISSTADQEHLALGTTVARVKSIVDTANDWPLFSRGLRDIRHINPNQTTGDPVAYAVLGNMGVAVQPTDASQVYVDSTSASDTGSAYIEGTRANLFQESETITMTGTTGVASAYSDWTSIEKFYLSASAVGTVTLHEDSEGGTTLSTILLGDSRARYFWILLDPVPSTARSYRIDYVRAIGDLANAADEPYLPQDFHSLLAIGARAKEYERREDMTRWQAAQLELQSGVRNLKFWIADQGYPEAPTRTPGHSQLGPWYPAGS